MPTTLPQRLPKPKEPKPPVMTPLRVALLFTLSGFFDLLRFYFALFFITGPATAAAGAFITSNSFLSSLGWLGKIASSIAGVGAALAAFGPAVALTPVGEIIGMIVGAVGFAVVGLTLLVIRIDITNNLISLLITFVFGEVPFVNALPSLTPNTWNIVRKQRKIDAEEQKKYKAALAAYETQQRQLQVTARYAEIERSQAEEDGIPGGLPA